MSDPRKAIFDAVRAVARPGLFGDPGNVLALDNLLDAFDVPRAGQAPKPAGGLRVSPAGIALIHQFESLMLSTYKDPGPTGLPITGGWGTTRDENGQPFKLGRTEDKAYWDSLFARDLAKFEKGVAEAVSGAKTSQGQFDALVSFAYNVGLAALKGSTLLKKHRAGDYAGAAAEFGRWNKAGGKVLKGLTRRRAAEAELYRS